jgi:tRNA (uracil-5-)-methyltransferase
MICKYFGICGSCTLHDYSYEDGLNKKVDVIKDQFSALYDGDFEIVRSKESNFRARAEFKLWHTGDEISYAMNSVDKKVVTIDSCSIVIDNIVKVMQPLIDDLGLDSEMHYKLFTVEYLSSLSGDTLVTLIYHKRLEDSWTFKAKELEKKHNIKIIGRSRKQKIVLSSDYITEELVVNNKKYYYTQYESSFTQPNPFVNQKMLEWAENNSKNNGKDLLELYCGNGNFTMVLSKNFDKVLATEISKASIKSATQNLHLNSIVNIKFGRMSSEEFVEASEGKREFQRLKDSDIELSSYDFSTVFVDPPRAGLDETTTNLIKKYENILYVSCNPDTLKRDLEEITKTHKIVSFALFDQFAYTKHLECGVKLIKI